MYALGTRGDWMGCWNNYIIITAHVRAVSGKEPRLLASLPASSPSRQTAPLLTLIYY